MLCPPTRSIPNMIAEPLNAGIATLRRERCTVQIERDSVFISMAEIGWEFSLSGHEHDVSEWLCRSCLYRRTWNIYSTRSAIKCCLFLSGFLYKYERINEERAKQFFPSPLEKKKCFGEWDLSVGIVRYPKLWLPHKQLCRSSYNDRLCLTFMALLRSFNFSLRNHLFECVSGCLPVIVHLEDRSFPNHGFASAKNWIWSAKLPQPMGPIAVKVIKREYLL